MSYGKSSDKKEYESPRPSSGMKPKGFKPGKKKSEESLGSQIIEANSKDSE